MVLESIRGSATVACEIIALVGMSPFLLIEVREGAPDKGREGGGEPQWLGKATQAPTRVHRNTFPVSCCWVRIQASCNATCGFGVG